MHLNQILRRLGRMPLFTSVAVLTLAIGIGANTAALAFMRLMSSMLFAVSPVDPMTYAMVSLMLMAAAALASYVPAMRASAVDPLEALRAE